MFRYNRTLLIDTFAGRSIDLDLTAHLPHHCSQCAARFPAGERGKERLQSHLDWHFRRNRKERESEGRGANRRWLPRADVSGRVKHFALSLSANCVFLSCSSGSTTLRPTPRRKHLNRRKHLPRRPRSTAQRSCNNGSSHRLIPHWPQHRAQSARRSSPANIPKTRKNGFGRMRWWQITK